MLPCKETLVVLTGIINFQNLPASSAAGAENLASSSKIWALRQQPHAGVLGMTVFTASISFSAIHSRAF